MIRTRVFPKVAVVLTLLVILCAGAIFTVVAPRVEQKALDQIDRSLLARAAFLRELSRPALEGDGVAALRATVRSLGEETGTRYTVIRVDGLVIADSMEEEALMERHDLRPEVRQAGKTGGPGRAVRHSRTTGLDMHYLALPVEEEGTLVGFVRASLPTSLVNERLAEIRVQVVLGAVIAAAVGLVIGLLLTRRLTSRLAVMARAARAIADGRDAGALPTGVRDETGDLARAIQSMDEQLRRRLDALVCERNEISAVLGGMREGVVAVDHEERVVHINAVAGKVLGIPPASGIGKRIWELTRVIEICEILEAVARDGSEQNREIRLAGPHRPRTIEIHASPLRNARQNPIGAVLVLHDVTELRRLETVRREFVANVSHELKTPLTALRGLIETLIDDDGMDEKTRRRFFDKARGQAHRLSTLVTDLLVLSRMESEEAALDRRPLDLRSPLRESVRRLDPAAAGRDVRLQTSLPSEPVVVLGDEEAVRQIVGNLLDNALKYTADGGSVSVCLSHIGDDAVIDVKDTGIGIGPEHVNRIFERFYRVDKARSRELGGTGLGLSIVKHLVEALGGHVHVESEPGQGSTFRVVFPLVA